MTKKILYLLFGAMPMLSGAQNCNFADSYLKDVLLAADTNNTIAKNLEGNYCKIDVNNDGEIQESEAAQIKELEVISASVAYFDGIEDFINLERLNCTNNGRLNTQMGSFKPISLDLSEMPNLKHLICQNNQLYLGIGSFTGLEELDLYHSRGFTGTLDFTAFVNLTELNCGRCNLTGINIEGISGLQRLDISFNDITEIDLSQFGHLKYFSSSMSLLASLDLSNHTELEEVNCKNSELATLNISGCSNLKKLNCTDTYLTELNAANLPQLEELYTNTCQLTSLSVSGSTNLKLLTCSYNQLTELDASNLPDLINFDCDGNMLQQLSVSGCPEIVHLNCSSNQLTTLDCREMSHLNYLSCWSNPLTELFIKNGIVEETLYITEDPSLDYVCGDEEQMEYLQAWAANFNPQCVVDSSCAMLRTSEFAQNDSITIYPNPVSDILNIETDTVSINEIKIYNTLGQMVLTTDETAIDVSALRGGNYFLKIDTDAGTKTKQFVKN